MTLDGWALTRSAAVLLVGVLGLAACGKDAPKPESGDAPKSTPSASTAESLPPSPMAAGVPYKVEFPPDLPFKPEEWTTVRDYAPIGDPRAKRVPGSTFTHWWETFITTLRTQGPNSNTTDNSTIESLVYESLVQIHPETSDFIPCLASHWKIETRADGTQTFTFRIDEKAKWADGTPVQADDVYWSWWHRVNPDRDDPSTAMTFKEGYHEPKILDRRTIEVSTREANWRLFLYFGGMQIYPAREIAIPGPKYLEEYNWKYPMGSGPYVLELKDVRRGESLTLTRRDDWWAQNEPWGVNTYNFDRVRFIVILELELAYEKFKKGELDWFQVGQARRWVEDVPREKIVQKGWVQRRKVYNKRPVGFSGLAFNQREWPFDDKRVRLAFAHLFNRERLMEKLFYNEYELTNSTYPGSDWGSGDEREMTVFDAGRASDLLAEAGYRERDADGYLKGPGGRRLEVTLEYGFQTWERIWLVVKEDYEKAGVRFNLKLIDASTLQKKISERQFKIHFQAWGALLFPNPETSWRSSLADQMNNNNITGFRNPRVDELCKKYNVTMDVAERKRIVREIDTLVCEDVPYAFGWHARSDRILYWDKFGHPDSYITKIGDQPEASLLLLWWADPEREKALKAAMEKDQDLPQGEVVVKPWG